MQPCRNAVGLVRAGARVASTADGDRRRVTVGHEPMYQQQRREEEIAKIHISEKWSLRVRRCAFRRTSGVEIVFITSYSQADRKSLGKTGGYRGTRRFQFEGCSPSTGQYARSTAKRSPLQEWTGSRCDSATDVHRSLCPAQWEFLGK